MKKITIDTQSGSIMVLLVGIFPILVILLCLFVNVILLVDSKIKMQASVDRGAYAGASYLSHVMDQVAGLNWEFRKKYLTVSNNFSRNSQESADWIDKQIEQLNTDQSNLYDRMNDLLNSGYDDASKIAKEVTLKNLSGIPQLKVRGVVSFYGRPARGVSGESTKMFDMINDCASLGDNCQNEETIIASEISGKPYDPTKYTPHPELVKKYLIKSSEMVALLEGVSADLKIPLLPDLFKASGSGVDLTAFSAAQPRGGSIKDFSFVDAQYLPEAVSRGEKFLYHPAFIPVKSVLGGIDAQH